ncbi:hypothetical protein ALC53_11795 [Atta colombica]|uniref:Gustatory receptor n=1 Tax=Atta colombica TaxID=520822 RepID=A0A195B0Q5_9HYME|nr:hypothetical protein ALC53_11795 [Atta colombica]
MTLQTTLALLLITGSFWSLDFFEYPLGQPRPYLSCLYTLATWSYLTYSNYYIHILELKMCLQLSIVNDTLEAFSAPKEYQRLRKWIIRIIIGWIAYISFYLAIYRYWLFLNMFDVYSVTFIYQIFLLGYPNFLNILSALIWGIILSIQDVSK